MISPSSEEEEEEIGEKGFVYNVRWGRGSSMLRGSKSKADVSGRLHKGRRGELIIAAMWGLREPEKLSDKFSTKYWKVNIFQEMITFIKITIEGHQNSKLLIYQN